MSFARAADSHRQDERSCFVQFRQLETPECPFANLPETKSGRWGFGLTAAKMKECRWLKSQLCTQFEFAEWRSENVIGTHASPRYEKKARQARARISESFYIGARHE
jgi:hypothetical protein